MHDHFRISGDVPSDGPPRESRCKWLADALSTIVDMLLIAVMAHTVAGLVGSRDHTTLAAMGIALYISCQHFKRLRREIEALRTALSASQQAATGAHATDWVQEGT